MKTSLPLRTCCILVVCSATLRTQSVLCRCKLCGDVGCGRLSRLRCNKVQNELPALPPVRTPGAAEVTVQLVRCRQDVLPDPSESQAWKQGIAGWHLSQSDLIPQPESWPQCRKFSQQFLQSKTVAAVFPFLCFKKTTASVTPQMPSSAPSAKSRFITPDTPVPLLAISEWTLALLLAGVCNSKSVQKKQEGCIGHNMTTLAPSPSPPSCLPVHDLLGSKDSAPPAQRRLPSSIFMVPRGRAPIWMERPPYRLLNLPPIFISYPFSNSGKADLGASPAGSRMTMKRWP